MGSDGDREVTIYRGLMVSLILGNFAFTFMAWREVSILNAKLAVLESILRTMKMFP